MRMLWGRDRILAYEMAEWLLREAVARREPFEVYYPRVLEAVRVRFFADRDEDQAMGVVCGAIEPQMLD